MPFACLIFQSSEGRVRREFDKTPDHRKLADAHFMPVLIGYNARMPIPDPNHPPPPSAPNPLVGTTNDANIPGVSGFGFGSGLAGTSSPGVFGVSGSFGVMGEVPDGLGNETQPIFPAGVLGRGGNNGDGVVGNSINHDGVVGDSVNGEGVRGTSHSANSGGVVGVNKNGGPAGFFDGHLSVNGDVTVTGNVVPNGVIFPDGSLQTTANQPGLQGPRGPAGPQGPQGKQGPQGSPGISPPPQVILSRDAGGAGTIQLLGPGGKQIVHLSSEIGDANSGFVAVTDTAGANASLFKAALGVVNGQGVISADLKQFHVPNPNQADTDIVYASIEGPEAAAYVRGTANLANGQAIVQFPDHFVNVISADALTVQVTPLSADSRGLAVIAKEPGHFVVKELNGGTGNYEFDWEAKSIRRGQENYQVIRPTQEFALPPLPVGPPVPVGPPET